MLGLALQTILLLVWNAWWVKKRGQFGRKASAARWLYPIVLGLGGWGLGALITTIVGAAAGGNLLLLTLDLSRDRQVRNQSALLT